MAHLGLGFRVSGLGRRVSGDIQMIEGYYRKHRESN